MTEIRIEIDDPSQRLSQVYSELHSQMNWVKLGKDYIADALEKESLNKMGIWKISFSKTNLSERPLH